MRGKNKVALEMEAQEDGAKCMTSSKPLVIASNCFAALLLDLPFVN